MTYKTNTTDLERYFRRFRKNIIGINQKFNTPFGKKKIVYADWTASGRLYDPIERRISEQFGPFVANTHTQTTVSGTAMTIAYKKARRIIKEHVNAGEEDILIFCDSGMTGAINKFQRILGLKIPENLREYVVVPEEKKPVVFITHMEHHSNQTSWLETIAQVEIIPAGENGLVCLENFKALLDRYKDHKIKIASVTACSNVTGIKTPYHEIAEIIHQHNGICFVDFACSAPYVEIDMHPEQNEQGYLDAIFISPHKFLGGPGSSGILLFNKNLYSNIIPDCPGGGTVSWTNPWGQHKYLSDIEEREDGGTPGFLQVIRTALAVELKQQMGVKNILKREKEILDYIFKELKDIPNLHILESAHQDRLGVISFYIDELHYNLGVKLLNDRFGIQTRGGCSCAGTYGHFLLNIDQKISNYLTDKITDGDLSVKPGWIRMSIHPTSSTEELKYICKGIRMLAAHHKEWARDYLYDKLSNEFVHKDSTYEIGSTIEEWFILN